MRPRVLLALFLAAAAWLTAGPGSALTGGATAPACTLPGEHLMSWPDVNPVWQFCWLRAADSSGGNGSGLEIRNVNYKGHLVMKRGHVPILNVLYDAGGCGCYRDWSYQEVRFQANNVVSPGYAEPTVPPQTVCDTGGGGGDIGSFTGVAAEKLTDRLILTTQFEAGWYRYTMKWRFYLDGRIEPLFGFAAINSSCLAFGHRHHAYWRFDFDIDTPSPAVVTEDAKPSASERPPVVDPPVILTSETKRLNTAAGLSWSITNSTTGRGYLVVPGPEVASLPADAFAVGDAWFLKYKSSELDDTGVPGTSCPINIGGFINGESTSSDVVMWYRGGAYHAGGDLEDCHLVGPTLVPLGDWGP
jgi:hypothetical protein